MMRDFNHAELLRFGTSAKGNPYVIYHKTVSLEEGKVVSAGFAWVGMKDGQYYGNYAPTEVLPDTEDGDEYVKVMMANIEESI